MGCGMVSKDRGREAVDEQNIGGQSSNMPRWILQISCAEAPHPTDLGFSWRIINDLFEQINCPVLGRSILRTCK